MRKQIAPYKYRPDRTPIDVYRLARDGQTDKQIAGVLGVAHVTIRRWREKYPALAYALDQGRDGRARMDETPFHDYVFSRLPENLQDLWRRIDECETLDNGIERIQTMLANQGVRIKQHLFLYALTSNLFNISHALRKLAIPRKQYNYWKESDPEFAELMDEIHWHKKNFFENAFLNAVANGETAAVIHGVKTQCRDRGYNEKIEVEHTGHISTSVDVQVTLDSLDLDIETRRTILTALRAKQALLPPPENTLAIPHTLDVESTPVVQ